MRNCWLAIFCLTITVGFSANINQTLFINSGDYTAVDASQYPYCSYNETSTFGPENKRIVMAPNDSLFLMIINNDTIIHGFDIKNYSGVNKTIPVGDTVYVACSFSSVGLNLYYDSYNYPDNRYMGLGGMIVVDGSNASKFFWNIK